MRGILINPWTKEITEVQVENDYREIYRFLSNPLGPKVETFCIGVQWKNGDTLYVDDEGYLKAGMRLFDIGLADDWKLAGNGLILGCDNQGESTDAKLLMTEVQCLVKWTNLVTAGAN